MCVVKNTTYCVRKKKSLEASFSVFSTMAIKKDKKRDF